MKFSHYGPEQGSNWNAMNGGGVWIREGESAIVRCPECGRAHNLRNHHIAASGEVAPAVTCVNSECDFSESISLDGWEVL